MTTQPPPQGNPFAQNQPQAPQQPQGQNPYAQGQPGFPQQAGQPGQPGFPQQGAPYAPVPPQPARRKPSFKTIKNIVIAVVVVGVAVGGYIASRDDADQAGVGDCLKSASSSSDRMEVVDCSSSDVGGQSFFSSKTHTPVMFWLSSLPSRTATATFVESPWAPYWALKNTLPGTVR